MRGPRPRVRITSVLALAAALCLPLVARAEPEPTFPEELTAIQMQYFRSLEPVVEKHRTDLSELRKAYYKELQELGRAFVTSRNTSGALAVKVEMQRLESPNTTLPAPHTQPPKELTAMHERFEEEKFKLDENQKAALEERATKYTEQLAVWSKLYRQRGNKPSAKAVDEEIKRIQDTLRGAPADVPATTQIPPLLAAPGSKAAAPAATTMIDGSTSTPGPMPDPLENAIDSATAEAGAKPAPAAPEAAPELPKAPDGLALFNGWQGTASKNRTLANELATLLNPYGTAKVNLDTFPGLVLYDKVRYLMPWPEAKKLLGLAAKIPKTGVVTTPGWPGAGSLKYYTFEGKFDNDYTKMTVITDAADHVVTLMLFNDSSGLNMQYRPLLPEYKYYDYVMGQEKKIEVDGIWHKIFSRNLMGEFSEETENILNPNTPCIRLDTVYFDANLKIQFLGRWYVVRPFLDTLLYSCNSDAGTAGR